MGIQYFCKRKRRLQDLRKHGTLNGIDYLEVLDREAIDLGSPRQMTLLVRCIKPLSATVSAENVRIDGGVRVKNIKVEWAGRAADADTLHGNGLITDAERDYFLGLAQPDHLLLVRTADTGDFSTYTLCLVIDGAPLAGFDPLLAQIDFSFKVECPSDFDCLPERVCPVKTESAPPIGYLAKDYASFRQIMLDRLSVIMPDWQDHLVPDLGVALVEVLAYVGDHLSYYQDAAATEAYLGTARQRPSLHRHARLLDYPMHDGCNSRAWVALQIEEGVQNMLLKREYAAGKSTQLLTKVPSQGALIAEEDFDETVAEHRPEIFEPMFDLRLYDAHNNLYFYTWGDEECCLPKGATHATLRDNEANRLLLLPGDVLILEERLGSATGQEADADPTHRHAVRLIRVDPPAAVDEQGDRSPSPLKTDELYNEPIVEIEWAAEDALPFPFCISSRMEQTGKKVYYQDMSIAHGNVVLVDHGRTVEEEEPLRPSGDRRYRPFLKKSNVTQCVPFDADTWTEYDPQDGRALSASAALTQDPRKALPAVKLLSEENEDWRPERDLLRSDRFDTDLVVEVEDNGSAALRFGDNIYGKTPEKEIDLWATYRIGRGTWCNVGAEAIAHILTTPGVGIEAVRNPMPASGGKAPEDLEEVRFYAPQAFLRQERAVTEADYAEVAQRHPEVYKAVARRRWTGSWHTVFITVDRMGGRGVDQAFEEELSAFIERFQLAGHDVEIAPPKFVPLDIAFSVCVEPGYLRSDVKQALLRRFSNQALPDGSRGFFHPDNFTFAQPVYLSEIIAAAMDVPGVRWVSVDPEADPPARFQRWGEAPRAEIANGYIDIGRLEIAQLDNDPNEPENGKIEFHMEGGL